MQVLVPLVRDHTSRDDSDSENFTRSLLNSHNLAAMPLSYAHSAAPPRSQLPPSLGNGGATSNLSRYMPPWPSSAVSMAANTVVAAPCSTLLMVLLTSGIASNLLKSPCTCNPLLMPPGWRDHP